MESETTLNDEKTPGYPCRLDRLVGPRLVASPDKLIGFVIGQCDNGLRVKVNAYQQFEIADFADGRSVEFETLKYLKTDAGQDAMWGEDRNAVRVMGDLGDVRLVVIESHGL